MTKKRMILLVLLIGAIAACAKTKSQRESEWHGLTESEARAKLDSKLPDKIPTEKRSAISDKVVSKMRDRGVISEDPLVPDDASSITDADELTTP